MRAGPRPVETGESSPTRVGGTFLELHPSPARSLPFPGGKVVYCGSSKRNLLIVTERSKTGDSWFGLGVDAGTDARCC